MILNSTGCPDLVCPTSFALRGTGAGWNQVCKAAARVCKSLKESPLSRGPPAFLFGSRTPSARTMFASSLRQIFSTGFAGPQAL